jgi:hypothetical protein
VETSINGPLWVRLGRFFQGTPVQCVLHPRPAPVLEVWLTTDSPAFTTELPVFTTEVSGLVVGKGSGVDPDEAHHKAGPVAGSDAAGGL